jgi:hypothetical protein
MKYWKIDIIGGDERKISNLIGNLFVLMVFAIWIMEIQWFMQWGFEIIIYKIYNKKCKKYLCY